MAIWQIIRQHPKIHPPVIHRSKNHNDHQQLGWQPALFWCVFCPNISFTYAALPLVVLHFHMNHQIATLLQFCFGFRGGCAKFHKFLRHALCTPGVLCKRELQAAVATGDGGAWHGIDLGWCCWALSFLYIFAGSRQSMRPQFTNSGWHQSISTWVFPTEGVPSKWMVYNGKPY